MGLLDQIVVKGPIVRPIRALVFGVEGVGKSTFAAGAPSPIFLDCEAGTLGLDTHRVLINEWAKMMDVLAELNRDKTHPYRTVVIDTLDGLERKLLAHICQQNNVQSIEDVGGGYGKGFTKMAEAWGALIQTLQILQIERGMHVIACAHAEIGTLRDPDGPEYNRWTLRMHKKTQAAWKGWMEEVLFATREVTTRGKADKKGKGGTRILYTEWAPGRDAKNRHDLPPRLPLDWSAFAKAMQESDERGLGRRREEEAREQEAEPDDERPTAADTGIASEEAAPGNRPAAAASSATGAAKAPSSDLFGISPPSSSETTADVGNPKF